MRLAFARGGAVVLRRFHGELHLCPLCSLCNLAQSSIFIGAIVRLEKPDCSKESHMSKVIKVDDVVALIKDGATVGASALAMAG